MTLRPDVNPNPEVSMELDHPEGGSAEAALSVEPVEEASALDPQAHTAELQARLGYAFRDPGGLVRALTHRSFANEHDTNDDNQRLEYLGDAVLDLVISTELFHRHPELAEGKLSFLRSRLVREEALAQQAEALELGRFLLLGRGEELSGGRSKPSLLADAYEAVLAAVYLDGGFEAVSEVIKARFDELLGSVTAVRQVGDCKTRLQELIQAGRDERPRYAIVSTEGPPHARVYTVAVSVGELLLGQGVGCSKKAAQQEAARDALERHGRTWIAESGRIVAAASDVADVEGAEGGLEAAPGEGAIVR